MPAQRSWNFQPEHPLAALLLVDRKSTRLNSSHPSISYPVFCLKKKDTLPLPKTAAKHLHSTLAHAPRKTDSAPRHQPTQPVDQHPCHSHRSPLHDAITETQLYL